MIEGTKYARQGGSVHILNSMSYRRHASRLCCFKGGAESFSRGYKELLRKNITVNSIAPAAIETSLFEGNKPEILNADLYPLGVGQTEDVANAPFLLQNGARPITGETLILDGGPAG